MSIYGVSQKLSGNLAATSSASRNHQPAPQAQADAFHQSLKVRFGSSDPTEIQPVQGKIGDTTVNLTVGDMTAIPASAYVLPEFNDSASDSGVGGAIIRKFGRTALNDYIHLLQTRGPQQYGDAHVTPIQDGKYIIHVVSADSGRDKEFKTIQDSVYHALQQAQEKGCESIVMPTLGTGALGDLTDEQSAKAMLSGIKKFADEGGHLTITIAVADLNPNDLQKKFQAFQNVLESGSYVNAKPEVGTRWANPGGVVQENANVPPPPPTVQATAQRSHTFLESFINWLRNLPILKFFFGG